jgi:hypothetical protein
MQPNFYIGSAMHHTLDREYSRSRKYFQLTNERLVQAELALRYWQDHDNLYILAPIPIYTDRTDYRSLEMAYIQEWQPRLNYPFICQFFHPKKGILKKTLLNTNAQFGLATLWRRAKHKFTPQLVRQILTSSRFQNRLELWTIIHALGANTKAKFEQTKMLRPNDGGLTLCYAFRRLANNIQEPFRTLSLNAIDASIKWWHGKPAPRASALRAPWSLTPNLQQHLRKFLRQWHFQFNQVPCHTPSFKMVFIKHAAVLDQLCNHKKATDDWSTSNPAVCCCQHWSQSFRLPLGPIGLSPSLLASTRTCSDCRGIPIQQSFSFQKGISKSDATWYEKLDQEKYRPCQTQTSPTYATTSGQNTPSKSPITSQSLPSPNFKPPLMAPFSIVRTSTPRLSVFIAHAYTTNPLSRLSKILRFSNNFWTNQSLLSLHSLNPFNDNMAKLILGQLALVANSQQDTF